MRTERTLLLAALLLFAAVLGCKQTPETAPVSGVVLLDGEPLKFGFVTFQPSKGQPAKGEIQSDGSFAMSSYRLNDGAIIGTHRVSVKSYEGHDPAVRAKQQGDAISLGKSLLPIAYSRSNTSSLTVEVPVDGLTDYKIELSSKGPDR